MRLAAVTMAYNEPVWAPAWARHYAAQVGAEHCLLLDHGTDDGSTSGLPVPVRRLPRSPLDDAWRVAQVSAAVADLLQRYDAVIHTDADELLLADPAHHADLRAFAAAVPHPVVTAIGLDVQHLPDEEPALDPLAPFGAQREWVRFSAAMCKPALVRRAVAWSPGFHCCNAPLVTDRLYLLHMRYADLGLGLRRLSRTRGQAFSSPDIAGHQRVPDGEFAGMMQAIAGLPRRDAGLEPNAPPMLGWLERLRASRAEREGDVYKLDLSLSGDELWRLPGQFRVGF